MRTELDEMLYGYYGRLAREAALRVRLSSCEENIAEKRALLASDRFLRVRVTASIGGAETHQQGLSGDATANSAIDMVERKRRHEQALDHLIDQRLVLLDDLTEIAALNAYVLIAFDYISPDDQQLIVLCFRERRSFRAIGREMNIEASTVSARIDRLATDFPLLVKEIKSGNLPPRKPAQHKVNNISSERNTTQTNSEEMLLSYS